MLKKLAALLMAAAMLLSTTAAGAETAQAPVTISFYSTQAGVDDATVALLDEFMAQLYAKTMELGGKISGEHGIGRGKVKYLAQEVGHTNLALQQGIKKVFDPNLILNPGKVCCKL